MKVLIGVDDSSHSTDAVSYVLDATWSKASQFVVLSAVEPIFVGPGEAAPSDAIARLMEEQEKYHQEIAQREAARLREEGLTADTRVVVSDPRTALLEAARSLPADLIVVGSHGRTGIQKLLLGSVASHIVTHAPCSVLVVRRKGVRASRAAG